LRILTFFEDFASALAKHRPWERETDSVRLDRPARLSLSGVADACLLSIGGVLDDKTYVPLRDAIVKTALDEPRALIVDVTGLTVRNDPAWAVFTSARWQIAEWPDTPLGLVCAHEQRQECPAPQRHKSLRARLPDAGVRIH
jgi:hypothetical protein